MTQPILIDCHYLHPHYAGAYLVVEGDRAVLVENNTTHARPFLLQAMTDAGIRPEQVEYLIITHVHLDHAGGSGAMMQACPNATLLAHPRAAPHVIDPSRLVASARKVYGDERFNLLYGEIPPVEASRVRAMQDGEELRFGSRTFRFMHVRGHANHHFCIQDSGSNGIFTGDAFGMVYPALQDGGLCVFPSTSPTDFDPTEAHKALDLVVQSGARTAYLTHYGPITQLQDAASQLHRYLDTTERILDHLTRSGVPAEQWASVCEQELLQYFHRGFEQRPLAGNQEAWAIIQQHVGLNAAGMAHHLGRRKG